MGAGLYKKGSEIDVPIEEAKYLIDKGLAKTKEENLEVVETKEEKVKAKTKELKVKATTK